ncbi:MAG: hypothetical protein HYS15_02810 [Candidatus Spechtbacteria bacterium]|nr:hypothetical protein [Candidatus Spechtbacteria bacterium]
MQNQSYRYGQDVNYIMLDKLKVAAQKAAKTTMHNAGTLGVTEITASRGESCFLFMFEGRVCGLVLEGLGTKNRANDTFMHELLKFVAQAYAYNFEVRKTPILKALNFRPYFNAGIDTAMMIFIDAMACGIKPAVLVTYYAVGASDWFTEEKHIKDYCAGIAYAANRIDCVWGGGETPTLVNTIYPDTADLAGATWGVCIAEEPILGQNLKAGNRILLVESTGLQANYLSGARRLASSLKTGYLAPLSDGTPFGLALSRPTDLRYIPFIEALIYESVQLQYIVPITGHGLRKIMRARQPFTYRLHSLAPLSPLFRFMIEGLNLKGEAGAEEAMGGMNLGQGLALMVEASDEEKVIGIAKDRFGLKVWAGGEVEEGPRQVVIEHPDPIFEIDGKIVFDENSMRIRS